MILVDIKPRQDNLYDMYVGDEGDHFVNSNQGYENAEDAIAIARRLWPPLKLAADGIAVAVDTGAGERTVTVPPPVVDGVKAMLTEGHDAIVMRITYRDGKTRTEQLR